VGAAVPLCQVNKATDLYDANETMSTCGEVLKVRDPRLRAFLDVE